MNALVTRLLTDAEALEARTAEITTRAATAPGCLTDAEQAELDQIAAEHQTLLARAQSLNEHDQRIATAAALRTQVTEPAAAGATVTRAGAGETLIGGARVTSEPAVYREGGEDNFLTDAWSAMVMRNSVAGERIDRNQRQVADVYRDVATSNISGLLLPQYLVDMVAPLRRARNPLAQICNRHPLPKKGTTCYISRITTGGSMGVVASEGAQVANGTDLDDTLLTIPLVTIAGRARANRLALDRGEGIEDLLLQDAALNYSTTQDSQIINGAGSSGEYKGIRNTSGVNAVTYTDASPTVAEMWPKLAKAVLSDTGETVFESATDVVMRPRRFAWMASALDGNGRPLVLPTPGMAQNPMATGNGLPTYGRTGYSIMGAEIHTDGNIPGTLGGGTEDIVLAVNRTELHLWDDPAAPLQLKFEDVNTLKVDIVLFGYSAFTCERYAAAHSIISGTGLVAPTF